MNRYEHDKISETKKNVNQLYNVMESNVKGLMESNIHLDVIFHF